MSRLITVPNSCIRSVISLRDAPAPAQRASSKLWEKTGWSRRKDRGQIALSPFLFQEKSLVSTTLSSEAHHLSLRGNTCVNELFFFSEETFFLFLFLWLKRLHQPPPPLQLFTQFPAHRLSSLHLSGAFGMPEIFFFFFSFSVLSMYKNKFLNHHLKFARTFAHVKNKTLEFAYWGKDGTFRLKLLTSLAVGCSGSQAFVFFMKHRTQDLTVACAWFPLEPRTCGLVKDQWISQMCMKFGANGVRS